MANISNSGLWCLCGYLADLGGRVDMSPVCWSQDPSTQGQWGSRYPAPWSPGSRKERISEHGLRFLSLDQLLAQVCTKKRPGSKQPMALWPKPCKSLVEKPRWLATPLTECHLKREGRYLPPCGALSALWGSEGRQQQTGGCRSPEAALRPFHEAVPIGHLRCQRMEDQCPGSLHGSSPVCPQEQEETLGSALQHLVRVIPLIPSIPTTQVTFLFQRMRFTSCCIFLYRNIVSALVLSLSLLPSLHLPVSFW